MREIRYIHAADLHLDTPFQGIGKDTGAGTNLSRILQEAPFAALARLVRLCQDEKPDFLVLAGDIYNREEGSIRAQLALRDACCQLGDIGIRVFIAHGNHDPLSSRMSAIDFPPNTIIFGPSVESHILQNDGKPIAIVHGISHESDREGKNLAKMFRRDAAFDCFQLGVLHCSIETASDGDRYAPCSLSDLCDSGLDAWALGHVHARSILSERPFIAYSGNTQGLHINESGPKGCLLVTASPLAGSWHCEAQFRPLCSIQWETVDVDLDGIDKIDGIEQKLNDSLETARTGCPAVTEGLIARVHLLGRTTLNQYLRRKGSTEELMEILHHFTTGKPAVWIKDFAIDTGQITPVEDYLARDDLLGECARLCNTLRANEENLREICEKAFAPLMDNNRYRKAVQKFDAATLNDLLNQAERLCQETLEGH